MEHATRIEKESIAELHFIDREVLHAPDAINSRRRFLEDAMHLGNGYKGKVHLVFESQEGTHVVETTVWATTDHDVTLKGGITIPISCIRQVIL